MIKIRTLVLPIVLVIILTATGLASAQQAVEAEIDSSGTDGISAGVPNEEFIDAGRNNPPPANASSQLIITLPPRSVYIPAMFQIAGRTYSLISGPNGLSFQGWGNPPFNVSLSTVGQGEFESYRITVWPLERGGVAYSGDSINRYALLDSLMSKITTSAYSPPPAGNIPLLMRKRGPEYPFRLTFNTTGVSRATVQQLALAVLNSPTSAIHENNVYIGDEKCVAVKDLQEAKMLCFKTIISAHNFPGAKEGSVTTLARVDLGLLGVVQVEGNVLASESIANIFLPLAQNWLAVGGTFVGNFIASESLRLSNYMTNNATKLRWDSIEGALTSQFNIGEQKGSRNIVDGVGNINLNSPSHLIKSSMDNATSFTTQPGGKIWYHDGDLDLDVGADGILRVRGQGTLVVNGDVRVGTGASGTSSRVNCIRNSSTGQNTQFGVIAKGNITFFTPNIACGAYLSLGGNISFPSSLSGSNANATGIFIAKGNINVPNIQDSSRYIIRYDSDFANNPSILFSDILRIVFTTTS